jgi:hypothetical protein
MDMARTNRRRISPEPILPNSPKFAMASCIDHSMHLGAELVLCHPHGMDPSQQFSMPSPGTPALIAFVNFSERSQVCWKSPSSLFQELATLTSSDWHYVWHHRD